MLTRCTSCAVSMLVCDFVCVSLSLTVYRSERDQRGRPDGGAAHVLSGWRPAVSAARAAVPQPGPSGRTGGIAGRPLHTVSSDDNTLFPHREQTLLILSRGFTYSVYTAATEMVRLQHSVVSGTKRSPWCGFDMLQRLKLNNMKSRFDLNQTRKNSSLQSRLSVTCSVDGLIHSSSTFHTVVLLQSVTSKL